MNRNQDFGDSDSLLAAVHDAKVAVSVGDLAAAQAALSVVEQEALRRPPGDSMPYSIQQNAASFGPGDYNVTRPGADFGSRDEN